MSIDLLRQQTRWKDILNEMRQMITNLAEQVNIIIICLHSNSLKIFICLQLGIIDVLFLKFQKFKFEVFFCKIVVKATLCIPIVFCNFFFCLYCYPFVIKS